MEHRYLLTLEDLLERPNWAEALRVRGLEPGAAGGLRAPQRGVHCCQGCRSCAFPHRLQGVEMRPGEVLLTVNAYHSPMHLVAGDFSLGFPGRAQRARHGQQAQAGSSSAAAPASPAQAVYTCRRGFDATAGAVVPLRLALEGFGVA